MSVLVPPAAGRPTDEGWLASDQAPPPEPPGGAQVSDPAERLGPPMPSDRLRGWLVTLSLALIGGLVRFWNLAHPTDKGTPVFDEKHYVPQAWQVLRNGGYEDNPGFRLVVHPPLGKQLIAIGEWLFGYNGLGWRFTAAIAGTVCIILIVRIARRLTRSTLLGALAGVLLIADGVSHVQSRVGMLDIFLVAFVVAGFGALLVDRDIVRNRLATAVREGWATASDYGPRLGFRWWRFAGGVLLGLGVGVKWSALFFLAAFAMLSVFWDVTARRAAGVRHPWRGTIARDLFPAFASLAILPILVYFGTWWAWYASETGVDRHLVGSTLPEGGTWGWVPDALRALLYNNGEVLNFHNNLSPAEKHPYESKPWAWPMGLKPMLYYLESNGVVPGCGRTDCMAGVKLIGTPAMWWLAFPMLGWAIWRAFGKLDWRYAAVLVGYGAGWLPWFSNLDRQMYYFYATPMAPFMVLGLVLILGEILGKASDGVERRKTGLLVVALYVGLVIANFIWLWPILNGDSVTPWRWQAEVWLPSWN